MRVKSIKIAYLIEQNNFDAWFIGTEYCNVFQLVKPGSSRKIKTGQGNVEKKHHDEIHVLNVPTATEANDEGDFIADQSCCGDD